MLSSCRASLTSIMPVSWERMAGNILCGIFHLLAWHLKFCFLFSNCLLTLKLFFLFFRQWSWYWYSVWQSDHRLCQESFPEATALLICHSWLCFVWSYGSFLLDDGIFNPVCLVNCTPNLEVMNSCHYF